MRLSLLLSPVAALLLAAGCLPETPAPAPGSATDAVSPAAPVAPVEDPCARLDLQEGWRCIPDPTVPGAAQLIGPDGQVVGGN